MAWWRVLSIILCSLAAVFGAATVSARGLADATTLRVCVARAGPAEGDAPQLLRARFEAGDFDCRTMQRAYGSGDFWVRSGALPAGAGLVPASVRSASLMQRSATLAILYADGVVVTRHIDDAAAARTLALGAIFEQGIPVRGVAATRLLWHIRGSANVRGIVARVRVGDAAFSARSDLVMAAFYAAFAGLCIALLIYNLSLWAILRHDFQLAYCAMMVALLGYDFSSSGMMSWVWPELGNIARIRVNHLTLSCAGIAAIVFACRFFEPRVFAGRVKTAARAVIAALAVAGLMVAVCAPWQARLLDKLFGLAFLALMLFSVAVLIRAWQVRSNYLWLFAGTWAAPIIFAAVRVSASFALVEWNALLDNSTLTSMAAEAMLSSLAIAYRIRLLLIERDEARAQETAARLLADTDPLTGLLNRRAFLREAIGGEAPRLLLLADIDHFKSVNDTLGHDGGDEVLRRVAQALEAAAPHDALVARLGGEEFAVVVPATTALQPEALLAAVRTARMPFDVAITVSIGSAVGPIAVEAHWTDLYRRADTALYAAKRAGRDRARWSEPVAAAA